MTAARDARLCADHHLFRGEDGEIGIRSRYLADGYMNDPDRTKEKFIPQADGTTIYRTGDRGRFCAVVEINVEPRSPAAYP